MERELEEYYKAATGIECMRERKGKVRKGKERGERRSETEDEGGCLTEGKWWGERRIMARLEKDD